VKPISTGELTDVTESFTVVGADEGDEEEEEEETV